jgi:Protein of unknown function (DUF2510)
VSLPVPASQWPAPGWYPDPYGKGEYRYFDGANWTSGASPVPGYLAPAPPAPAQPGVAVAVANGGPNHALHAVLTLLTCGLWLPVWIIVAILGNRNGTAVAVSR